ncbi:MAG: HAD family hydrolase [Desulfobacterales bacterium]|nr:HAD family hydrolase [Desulfobacterales bacterium]
MIKAIIFDFGQTLVDSADGFRSAERIAKEKIFLSLFPHANDEQWQSFLTEYRQIRKSFHVKSIFSRPAIWQAVYDRFNARTDYEKLGKMETEYWELVKSQTTPFPETLEVLEKLSKLFQLGIITNTQGQKRSNTHRIALFPGIEKFFKAIIIAGESELPPKPDPQPFLLCLEKMNIKPGDAIYVGDDFQNDVCGASYAGLQPIWIKHSLVKRSWPDSESHTQFRVITNLNQLLEIDINRLDP